MSQVAPKDLVNSLVSMTNRCDELSKLVVASVKVMKQLTDKNSKAFAEQTASLIELTEKLAEDELESNVLASFDAVMTAYKDLNTDWKEHHLSSNALVQDFLKEWHPKIEETREKFSKQSKELTDKLNKRSNS